MRESDVRYGLAKTEADFVEHFRKKGKTEREARELARKMMARNIGSRVNKMHRHDASKEHIAEANRAEVARQKAEHEESKNRAEHEATKAKTGRIYI